MRRLVKMDFVGKRASTFLGLGLIILITGCLPLQLMYQVKGLFPQEATSQCVQVGQKHQKTTGVHGPFTIGGRKFQTYNGRYLGLNYYVKPAFAKDPFKNYNGGKGKQLTCNRGFEFDLNNKFKVEGSSKPTLFIDLCPKDIEIRTYLVRQGGRVLRGWLHFEVEITNPKDEMEHIYVQIRDEAFNAIGEFVSNEEEQCGPSKGGLLSPTKYQLLPCSATGPREAKTSQAIFMAKYTQYQLLKSNDPSLPKKDLKRGIHFTWRLNEYWCNRHWRLRADANVWSTLNSKRCTEHSECRSQRKVTDYWLHPKWFGAADIKLPGTPLNCSTLAIEYKTGSWQLTRAATTWLASSSELVIGEDYVSPDNVNLVSSTHVEYKSCQVDISGDMKSVASFGGRCPGPDSKVASLQNYHRCNLDPKSKEFSALDPAAKLQSYSDYRHDLTTARLFQCKHTCVVPESEADLEAIKSKPGWVDKRNKTGGRKTPVHFGVVRRARLRTMTTTFWVTRKYHGSISIFCAMFLMPISHFLMRYFKETFMDIRGMGCPPWYWVHFLVAFAVPVLMRSSFTAMRENTVTFGKSDTFHGGFHRYCGNFFHYVYLIMVCIGGIRPASPYSRLICMTMHAVTGFVLYLMAIGLIINSSYIPASPSLHECDGKTGLPTGFSAISWLALTWLIIDFIFHAILTVDQLRTDKRLRLDRPGRGLPFIPILPSCSRTDFVGSGFRKILLLIYISLAFIMTLTSMIILYEKEDPGNCTLGPLSCNLSDYHPEKANLASPFGCSKMAVHLYHKVYHQYDIQDSPIVGHEH